jgi:3-oxo-5-alpha-steroid 4-dehydrogenase 3
MLAVPIALQCFYVLAAATILLANSIPSLRTRFVAYGKATSGTNRTSKNPQKRDAVEKLLDFLGTFTVPHSYFTHFYILSLVSSLFWGYQIATHGAAYRYLADLKLPDGMIRWGGALRTRGGSGIGIQQVAVVWLAMLIQGARRSYECLYIQKPGQASRMWVIHYLVGLAFYATVNIALWIEGTGSTDSLKVGNGGMLIYAENRCY